MKRAEKFMCILLVSVFLLGNSLPIRTHAMQTVTPPEIAKIRATNSFEATIQGKTTKNLRTALPLASGESVTIDVQYSPQNADVDVGLISSDGLFHYVPTSGGHVNVEISVNESDEYIFAIRNNSSMVISVSGQIKY